MDVSLHTAYDLVKDTMRANLVPMLHGSPGVGKSDLSKKLAKEYNLLLIDLRLSQLDPTDLSGFPSINSDRTKAGYVPMDTFPIKGDRLPLGYKGWLLMLDEFNSASKAVQAAAYKLVLDRQVGQFDLHEHVYIIAAGNKITDKAIVNPLSTAMQSRMVHLNITPNVEEWLKWAETNGIDYRVTSFIRFKPSMLTVFNPDHSDVTFACGRTWEFLSKIIIKWSDIHISKLPLLAGTVGEGVANEFIGYCDIFTSLPTIKDIIAYPDTINIPNEPSIKFALAGLVSHHANVNNLDALIKFVHRMPAEFQVITMRGCVSRTPELLIHPETKKWIAKTGQLFI